MHKLKWPLNLSIAGVILLTLFFSARVQAVLYDDGPTVDIKSINVSNKEVGPNERIHISMKITDEDPIELATVKFKSQLNINRLVVLNYNEESALYEGSLTIEDDFDIGEWSLYEISLRNSLNERTLIYADYVKNERFRIEDLSEHSFFVVNTNPPTIDLDSFNVSNIQQYEHKLDLSFRINNPQYLWERYVSVGYLGPKEENSIYPNIKYFQLHVDEDGFVSSGGRTSLFNDNYAEGEWKLISITLYVNHFGGLKVIYDSDYNQEYNFNSGDFGTADLGAGDFILQEKASGTPLLDLSTLQVEKDVYTAGETVNLTVEPLVESNFPESLTINYRYPNSNEIIGIGGFYDHNQQKYIISFSTSGDMQAGDWIIDNIQQYMSNGDLTYIYSSGWYGEKHYDLNSGSFTLTEDLISPEKPEVTEVSDQMTEVQGTAEPGSKVVVKLNGVTIGEGVTDQLGQFLVEIPRQKAGTELAVFVTDRAGNRSEATFLVVLKDYQPGWNKINTDWYYFDDDKNEFITGWLQEGKYWYYFSEEGSMKSDWIHVNNKWYYLNGSGQMQTGWLRDGGEWYYMNNSGAMQTGWVKVGNTWYFMNNSGAMKTGWVKSGSTWYFMNNSGKMQTGWVKLGSTWYYMNSSGAMQNGWQAIGGKWYYFYGDGSMAKNKTVAGYILGSDGAWIN